MNTDQEELRTFVAKVETALTPGFSEVLSEETRKAQRALLVLSFLLLLVVLGAISFSGDIEFVGIKFAGTGTKGTVVTLGLIVCTYLEVLVAIRCYSEWHLWCIRTRMGELDAKHIKQDLSSLREAIMSDLQTISTGHSTDDVTVDIKEVAIPLRGLLIHSRYPLFFQHLLTRLGVRTHGEKVGVMVSSVTKENLARLNRFGPHYMRFYRDSEAYERSRRARICIEIVFPLLFGLGASIYAYLSLLGAI